MKRIFFGTLIIAIALFSCKTTKKAATTPAAPTSSTAPAKVFSVPKTTTESKPAPVASAEKPITPKKEQFTFTQQEDKTANETNSFFVIVGSFSQLDNANKFKTTLISEGFTPMILHSETGYYRVCVNSYKNEASARERIAQIRTNYPKYADTWLLTNQ
jgi:cell division protein FtsN